MSVLPLSTYQYGGRVGRSLLSTQGVIQTVQGTAYFVYIGLSIGQTTVTKHVELYVTTAATGAQVAEVGLFSSVDAPNRLPVSLTKIAASGSVTPFSTTGVKTNLTAFTTPVTSLVHLWAGFRCNTTGPTSSKPVAQALANDWGYGLCLNLVGSPPLTDPGPFLGTPMAPSLFLGAPDLRVTLD